MYSIKNKIRQNKELKYRRRNIVWIGSNLDDLPKLQHRNPYNHRKKQQYFTNAGCWWILLICWCFLYFEHILCWFSSLLLHSFLHGRLERCVAYLPQLQLRHRKVQKIMIKSEEKSSKKLLQYLLTINHFSRWEFLHWIKYYNTLFQ